MMPAAVICMNICLLLLPVYLAIQGVCVGGCPPVQVKMMKGERIFFFTAGGNEQETDGKLLTNIQYCNLAKGFTDTSRQQ